MLVGRSPLDAPLSAAMKPEKFLNEQGFWILGLAFLKQIFCLIRLASLDPGADSNAENWTSPVGADVPWFAVGFIGVLTQILQSSVHLAWCQSSAPVRASQTLSSLCTWAVVQIYTYLKNLDFNKKT